MFKRFFLCSAILIFFSFNFSLAEKKTFTLNFSQEDLSFTKSKGYDIVYLKGGEITDRVGEPQLPMKMVSLAIPAGSKVENVEMITFRKEELEGEFEIFPAQPPQTLTAINKKEKIPFVEPDLKVYSSKDAYPRRVLELAGTGNMVGYEVTNLFVYPLEYHPDSKKLSLYTQIEFEVVYERSNLKGNLQKRKAFSENTAFKRAIQKKVLNPQDLEASPQEYQAQNLLEPGDYEYVVITSGLYESGFESLVEWKTKKGIPAKIVLNTWIYVNYSGVDLQDRIRNFIIDARQNWGTRWVLLGGDNNAIPDRKAFAMDCEYGSMPDENDIPCDLYYSDLDGSWDSNGNQIYGEVADSVEMYPDMFVGRAPIRSADAASNFCNKVITYEKNPPTDYQTDAMFTGEVMWWDPFTDGGDAKNHIDDQYFPPRFDPITKLYQTLGNLDFISVWNAIHQGQNLMNHNGHAWIEILSIGSDYLSMWDCDYMYNSPRNGILFSIGCWPAAFDYDCFAERFVKNANGGGVAFIGNSRYGWGSPGNPEYGYSDRFDQQFFRALFLDDIKNIGAALADAKATYVSRSGQENVYRWCQYQITLMGDPEMPIWTDTPQNLMVYHPDTLPPGQSPFTVTVTSGFSPVEDALVCLSKEDEIYLRGRTDSQGQITLQIEPSTSGNLYVTVTAPDFLPFEGIAKVWSVVPPYLVCQDLIIDDSEGNSDGEFNPGETLSLSFNLKNLGLDSAYNINGYLRTENGEVTLLDSSESFGDLGYLQELESQNQFRFSLSENLENGEVVYFDLDFEADSWGPWSAQIPVQVATPMLAFHSYTVDDRDGDHDGIPDPDEIFNLMLTLKNQGLATAKNVEAKISTSDPSLNLIDSVASYDDIRGGWFGTQVYRIQWTPGSSVLAKSPGSKTNIQDLWKSFVGDIKTINLEIEADEGYFENDNFNLSVGIAYYEDDVEDGTAGWTHSGTSDLWHISEHRSHSSSHSWYCGQEGTWQYLSGMDCWLVSPYFELPPNSYLSFWRWFDVAIYGVNGFWVQVDCGSGWQTLDFIGSGGALDSAYMGDDWHIEIYDLSSYPAGNSCRLRFKFTSDNEPIAEGAYIDDIRVGTISFPGDVNCDKLVDVSDIMFIANYKLKGGPSPNPKYMGDVNCNAGVDLADAIYLANYIFKSGPPPCSH